MISLILLALLCRGVSAGCHSLRFFCTTITPNPSLPQFVVVGYVDEVQFLMYDSDRKKLIPREQWMVESEGHESWERKILFIREQEEFQKADLHLLMTQSNQSGGIHTYQVMIGCDLRDDGTRSGFVQRGWDGRDFISFDKDHLVWVTAVPWGVSIKNMWDQDMVSSLEWKDYLEEECIEWLRKYLQYGQQLLRVVPPIVSLFHLGDVNRLCCVVTGFYPRAIEVTLWRDGMLVDETLSSGILPNHNGTYQIQKWVQFEPEDEAEYSCQVQHSGLEEMVVRNYVLKPDSMVPAFVICFGVLGLLIALAIVAVIIYKKKASDKGESSSSSSATT